MTKGTRAESAAENLRSSKMNCAQSVLTAYSEDLGLDKIRALKVAYCFGGGMGRTGNTCGAVTGAYMVIGLRQDMDPETIAQNKERVYELVKEFNRRFTAIHGSTVCRELLGYDPGTPEGAAAIREKDLHSTVCTKLVRDAAAILEEMK